MIRRFIQYYKPQKKLFFLDMVAAFFIAVCDLFYPMITRNMLNDYIPNRQLRLLLIFSAALIAIYFIKMLLSYFVQYYGHMVGVYMQADMRRDLFRHLQKLPFSFFDENETGNIMSRVVNDLQDISELAHHGPEDIFISAFDCHYFSVHPHPGVVFSGHAQKDEYRFYGEPAQSSTGQCHAGKQYFRHPGGEGVYQQRL